MNKVSLKINKIYKELMDEEDERAIFQESLESGEPVSENFNWINNNNKSILKKYYCKYPFPIWKKIIADLKLESIDPKTIYEKIVNIILQKEVFNNYKFIPKEDGKQIFNQYLEDKKIEVKDQQIKNNLSKIIPDFLVIDIPKEKFITIMKDRCYMFRYGNILDKINEITKINLIGEIKLNPESIKKEQKNRYLNFSKYMNKIKNTTELYFTIYVFNSSYPQFWAKKFHLQNPLIISYIPKLYENKCYDAYYKILNEFNNKQSRKENAQGEDIPKNEEKNLDSGDGEDIFTNKEENEKNENSKYSSKNKDSNEDNYNKSDYIVTDKEENVLENNNKEFIYEKDAKEDGKTSKNEKDLIIKYRLQEDKIRKLERNYEDEKEIMDREYLELELAKKKELREFEENKKKELKIKKREHDDKKLKNEREIQDEKYILENLKNMLNRKIKRDNSDNNI